MPFVSNYLGTIVTKVQTWVVRAIELDKFIPESPENDLFYSSSVVDLVTSFRQQCEFIVSLNWPNETQRLSIYNRLVEHNLFALENYLKIIAERAISELNEPSKTYNIVKKGIQKKYTLGLQTWKKIEKLNNFAPKDIRITNLASNSFKNIFYSSCILLANILSLPFLIRQIITESILPFTQQSSSKQQSDQSPPPLPPKKYQISRQNSTTHLPTSSCFSLQIQRGRVFPIVYPHTTEYTIQITNPRSSRTTSDPTVSTSWGMLPPGTELGRSINVAQRTNPIWDDVVPVVVDTGVLRQAKGLDVAVMCVVPIAVSADGFLKTREYVLTKGWLEVEPGQRNEVHEVVFANGARVAIGVIEILDGIAGSIGKFERVARRFRDRVVDVMVEKFCVDLRERIKLLSQKYKTTAKEKTGKILSKMFLNNDPELEPVTLEEVQTDLTPILDFVDVNLSALMDNLSADTAFDVAKSLWDAVLIVLESLVVPTLSDEVLSENAGMVGVEQKEKKAWKKRRIAFLENVLLLLRGYFNSEGDGIPHEELKTLRYLAFKEILNNYFKTPVELMGIFKTLEKGDKSREWVLKILKLRGERKFVNYELKLLQSQ
ncbi:hypothetical protein HK096_006701 [Nowakowskiella sp. JEL0078]|nr:hypothetical protein HK096_006701 [Nowakowskiella sp. JEL0078]